MSNEQQAVNVAVESSDEGENTQSGAQTTQSAEANPTLSEDWKEELQEGIVDALKLVYDPEIPVNIYDLGLIYDIEIDDFNHVDVTMTLTTPGCPVAQTFPDTIRSAVESVAGVAEAKVEVVWEPPWTQDLMSDAAKLQLGML